MADAEDIKQEEIKKQDSREKKFFILQIVSMIVSVLTTIFSSRRS